MEHKIFALGDFALQKGGAVIPDAQLGYVNDRGAVFSASSVASMLAG